MLLNSSLNNGFTATILSRPGAYHLQAGPKVDLASTRRAWGGLIGDFVGLSGRR